MCNDEPTVEKGITIMFASFGGASILILFLICIAGCAFKRRAAAHIAPTTPAPTTPTTPAPPTNMVVIVHPDSSLDLAAPA